MSEALKTAQISAVSGLVGVLVGAVISGFFAYKIAQIQLQQSVMTTAAASALNVRSTLADKAAAFFEANQSFLVGLQTKPFDYEKVKASANALDKARSSLTPYLDADLLIACEEVADSVRTVVSDPDIDTRHKAFETYKAAYKNFVSLYLGLRRELERSAQLNVVESQISRKYK